VSCLIYCISSIEQRLFKKTLFNGVIPITFQNRDLIQNIGQLMVFGFYGRKMTPELKQFINKNKLGNIILFSRNIDDQLQIRQLTMELQGEAKRAGHKHPLLICTDQENGAVRRLGSGSTEFPGSMLIGATYSTANAFEISRMTAEELKSVGINWNLAPVVDVNNNPANPVICTRSFGEDPQVVAEMGEAFMRGMQSEGIVSTLKHFPGHGDTGVDSHLDLPVIPHNLERLESVELVPFRKCIKAGADVIMSAHVYFPAIEKQYGLPATLSKAVLTGLLRERLHFQGVITTDCLEMKAIDDRFGTAQGAVMAFQAGADFAMVSHTFEKQKETLEAVTSALENGKIDTQSVRNSMERIDRLKDKYLDWGQALKKEVISVEKGEEHWTTAEKVYHEGITLLTNKQDLLPLSDRKNSKTLFLYSGKVFAAKVEDQKDQISGFESIVKSVHTESEVAKIEDPSFNVLLKNVISNAESYQAVVLLTVSITKESSQIDLLTQLKKTCNCPVIVIAAKSPYDLRLLPQADGYICTYDFNPLSLKIAIRSLFGLDKVYGRLPISLNNT
jgi:beta-N-acetylhexosaminidase